MTHHVAAPVNSRWRCREYDSILCLCLCECVRAVNMRGTKHSCGMLLIGALASWGSKHMWQLRSDSCCVAGSALQTRRALLSLCLAFGECLSPSASLTEDNCSEVRWGQKQTRQCLWDAIIGRWCRAIESLRSLLCDCFFFCPKLQNFQRNPLKPLRQHDPPPSSEFQGDTLK